jgi:5-methylthioadenosine/S-adenosylhomocysteine deaminase
MAGLAASQAGSKSGVTLVHPRFLVPVRPQGIILEGYSIAIEQGLIVSIKTRVESEQAYPEAESIDLPDQVLLPGFINMHTHSSMTLLRGYADDIDLDIWLREHIWPAEQEFVGPSFVADGARLAIAEMFRSGTTCFNDMYFYPDVLGKACLETGIRASIGVPLIDTQEEWAAEIDRNFEQGLKLHDEWRSEPLLSITFAPHAPYSVSDETLRRVATFSKELDVPVHLHLLETKWDIKHSLKYHKVQPLERLRNLDLLNSRLLAVHMTQISSQDIDQLAETDAHVIHCPQSNLKLASGICPIADLLDAGVNVALGTDGAAANNDLDLLCEAQTAALLAKGISGNVKAVDAIQALEMMTINGAKALGIDKLTGSIEPGKVADLCAIDLSQPETQPLYHVVSQVIYAASRGQVSDVWVAGKRVLESGQLTTINLKQVTRKAGQWQRRLSGFKKQRTV